MVAKHAENDAAGLPLKKLTSTAIDAIIDA